MEPLILDKKKPPGGGCGKSVGLFYLADAETDDYLPGLRRFKDRQIDRSALPSGKRAINHDVALRYASTLNRYAFDMAVSGHHTVDAGEAMAARATAVRKIAE